MENRFSKIELNTELEFCLEGISAMANELGDSIEALTSITCFPASNELNLALQKLAECMFWVREDLNKAQKILMKRK